MSERIAKVLARAGIASRREVERMIAAGRIALRGVVLDSPVVLVESVEGITVDDKPVHGVEATRLWRYHKPFGLMTTHRDPQGRPTVFENLPQNLPRVISVGRLDQNTEGLLLLTNDGELARWMELPATGWRRLYRVRVRGNVRDDALAELQHGITIEGIHYGRIESHVEPGSYRDGGCWLQFAITEGKNREVRNVVRHLGLSIVQLMRVSYGPLELGTLPVGTAQEVPAEDVRRLRERE